MSQIADFYAKVMQEKELLAEVEKVLAGKEITEATDEQLTKIGDIAKKNGFEVTLEEAKKYLAEGEKELSDETMDSVAGGVVKGKVTCTGQGAGVKDDTKIGK